MTGRECREDFSKTVDSGYVWLQNKNLNDYKDLKDSLEVGMNIAGFTPIEVRAQILNQNEVVVFILLQEGHAVIRTYPELKYVSSDIFICTEDGKPEKAVKALKKIVKPEKSEWRISNAVISERSKTLSRA